jgi:hypothetical protein
LKLTDTQSRVLQLAANAELRTRQQMLSLLLAEAFRFYYMDREPLSYGVELNPDEITRQLMADAAAQTARQEAAQ